MCNTAGGADESVVVVVVVLVVDAGAAVDAGVVDDEVGVVGGAATAEDATVEGTDDGEGAPSSSARVTCAGRVDANASGGMSAETMASG